MSSAAQPISMETEPLASVIFETEQMRYMKEHHDGLQPVHGRSRLRRHLLRKFDYAMVAVGRGYRPSATSVGQQFVFERYRSTGWNFGLVIDGKDNFADIFETLLVKDCFIRTYTAPGKVSNPINAGNGKVMRVIDSDLIGDDNSDHAIYTIALREVHIVNNRMEHYANSAIKLMTAGSGGCPSTNDDYPAWEIRGNTFRDSILTASFFTLCEIVMPRVLLPAIASTAAWTSTLRIAEASAFRRNAAPSFSILRAPITAFGISD